MVYGEITQIRVPGQLDPGDKIELTLDAELHDSSRKWNPLPWHGMLVVSGNGYEKSSTFSGFGESIGYDLRTPDFYLGIMGEDAVTVVVKLYADPIGEELVKTEAFTVESSYQSEDGDDGDDDGGSTPYGSLEEFLLNFPWGWAGLGLAGLLAGVIALKVKR